MMAAGHGGRRLGAGRPKGSRDVLPRGAVKALGALRHRIPVGTPPEVAALADEAFDTIVLIVRGATGRNVRDRLTAARMIRDEIYGPQVLKIQHTTAEQHAEVVFVVEARERERRERERAARQMPPPTPIEQWPQNGATKNGA